MQEIQYKEVIRDVLNDKYALVIGIETILDTKIEVWQR